MESELILLDTSILIDYFRKEHKNNSDFYQLVVAKKYSFAVSVITEYEIYVGATDDQKGFWDKFFTTITVIDFNSKCAKEAVAIQKELKKKNKMIAIPDLLIAATATVNGLRTATKNLDHFKRIPHLQILV